ncbi:MAG: hypothetical protein QXT64_02295, partial [Desulfurococcaceae archaeon]
MTSAGYVEEVKLEPIHLSRSEAWFKLKGVLINLRFSGKPKEIELVIVDDTGVKDDYVIAGELDCNHTVIQVEGVNICSEIDRVIRDYPRLVRQYEIVEKARAIRLLDYQAVPSMPKEWEVLIYTLTRSILDRRTVKTFYIYEGSREVVLGIYCYENGYYRECEETLKHEISTILQESRLLDIRLIPGVAGTVVKNVEIRTMEYYSPAKHCLLFKDKVFCWDRFLETR